MRKSYDFSKARRNPYAARLKKAEKLFDRAIERSRESLERLADEAVAEHRAAKTKPRNPKGR